MKEYKFEGDTIKLEGWSIRFDKRRYRSAFLGDNMSKISWMCEGSEELDKFNECKEFFIKLLDREFSKLVIEQNLKDPTYRNGYLES